MKICGVVAEYNPFHSGHAYHLAQTRHLLGADTALVCAMSGNFVQRGDLAVFEKYERAEAAVRCGADLVLELPLSACLWSAEGFAWGAVSMLAALGCVTHLSFGAECADLPLLQRAAVLAGQQQEALRNSLSLGLSYAAAVQQTVLSVDPEAGALLRSPNNTLAIEYLRTLSILSSSIQPVAIERKGGAHDSGAPVDGLPSASYLRGLLATGDILSCRPYVPTAAYAVLLRAVRGGAAPVVCGAVNQAIVAHLRRLTPQTLIPYCGGQDGFSNRLADAIVKNVSFSAICSAAQTRRYPLARVRRALLRAWLDLPQSVPPEASYVRVLALGPRGRTVLHRMKQTCSLPILVKPAAARTLPQPLQPALTRDGLADDLYALAYPAPALRTGSAYLRKTPYFHPSLEP